MRLLLCFFLFILSVSSIAQSQFQTESPQLLIRLKAKANPDEIFVKYQSNARQGISIKSIRKVSNIFNIYTLQSNNNQRLMQSLKKDSEVIKVGYDEPLIYRSTTPNDVDYGKQWNMPNVQADLVWDETTGGQTINGEKIVIGILEKGIESDHIDLRENIWENQAEIPDNGIDDDENGYTDDYFGLNLQDLTDKHTPITREGQKTAHGTQVAGVIGAKGNNGIGVTGINWEIDLLLFSKVDFASNVIEAHEYAYNLRKRFNETQGESGAFIVALNHSFGWSGRPENFNMGVEMCEMMELLGQVGILSVASTYNEEVDVEAEGDVLPNCPSDFVVGVTSTNERNEKVKSSGYGNISIDLAAPGERIFTLNLDNGYSVVSGTSLASPMVAGAIGLLYSLPCERLVEDAISNPATTAKFMKEVILGNTQPIASNNARTVTNGRLDAFGAMKGVELYCDRPKIKDFKILKLYPNPVSEELILTFETLDFEPHQLIITNTLGQIIRQKLIQPSRFEDNILTEDVRNLPVGIYFVSIKRRKNITTERFLKEN